MRLSGLDARVEEACREHAVGLYRALHDLRDLAAWDHLPIAERARFAALLTQVDGVARVEQAAREFAAMDGGA